MRWPPGAISLRVKDQRNVVAAVVSTAGRGSPRQRYGGFGFSEDDAISNLQRRKYQAAEPHAGHALRTTRSTSTTLRDASALLSLGENGSPRESNSRPGFVRHG